MQTVMRETRLSDGAIRKAKRGLVKRGHLAPDGYSYSGTRRYNVSLPEPSTAGRNPVPPPGTRNRSGRNGVPVRAEPSTAKVGREEGRKRETPSYSPKGENQIRDLTEWFTPVVASTLQAGDEPTLEDALRYMGKRKDPEARAPSHLTRKVEWVRESLRRARARYEESA